MRAESDAVQQLSRRLAGAPAIIGVQLAALHAPDAAGAIVKHARDANTELIIMGLNGYDHGDFFMGSVAQQVVRQAPCPVMTLRGGSSRDRMTAAT